MDTILNLTPPPVVPDPLEPSREVGILRKLVSTISNALRPEAALTGFAKTAAVCLRKHGLPVCSAESFERIQAWHARWLQLEKIVNDHCPDNAYLEFQRINREHLGKVSDGHDLDVYTIEQVVEKFERTATLAKEAQTELYKANRELARLVAGNVADIIRATADRIEADELAKHELWGLPGQPSAIVRHLKLTEKFVLQMVQADESTLGPSYIFPWLPL